MLKSLSHFLFQIATIVAGGIAFVGCANAPINPPPGGRQRQGPQAVPVAVAQAERRDMPVFLTGLGSVEAFNTVVAKSRIDGQLVDVPFKEGQEVKKGNLREVID